MTYGEDYREDEPTDAQIFQAVHAMLCVIAALFVCAGFALYGFVKAVQVFLERVGLGG